jgi:hypothetical protein
MANFEAMDREIDELADEIGLDVARLQQLLPKDEQYIEKLVSLGRSQEFAERASFIGDLRNVVGLMASHNFSAHTAARMVRQTPENPVEISTTEDEEDEDEEQQQPEQQETLSSQDEASVNPGSSGSSWAESQSISSSEDEPAVEAKRLKLDPDYLPSDDTSVESTPETTAANSQLPSEEESEEEEETTESEEDETFVPNDTSEEEIEVAEEDEDSL